MLLLLFPLFLGAEERLLPFDGVPAFFEEVFPPLFPAVIALPDARPADLLVAEERDDLPAELLEADADFFAAVFPFLPFIPLPGALFEEPPLPEPVTAFLGADFFGAAFFGAALFWGAVAL